MKSNSCVGALLILWIPHVNITICVVDSRVDLSIPVVVIINEQLSVMYEHI